MSQQYVLTRPYKQFQTGMVLEPGSLLGDGLVRLGIAIKVGPREVEQMARRDPGALPIFPDAALRELMVKRGLVEDDGSRKVGKTSMLRRG